MVYKLDIETGVISPVSFAEARRALLPAGWSEDAIEKMSRSSKMLWTNAAYYCAVEFYLKEKREQIRHTASEGARCK